MQAIARTDLPVAIEGDGVEFRTERVGGMSVAWVRLPAGADLRPALAGLPGDLCPCPHWGYMISGRLAMHDCEYVDFSPSEELEAVVRHLQGR